MDRELIRESNSHLVNVVSVSIEGTDTILLAIMGEDGSKATIKLNAIGANGLRIAIGSLQDIPPHILPKNELGEYRCHYSEIRYEEEGISFEKENGETMPFGKYADVEDGLIAFNRKEFIWMCVSFKHAKVCTIATKEYLVFILGKDVLLGMRKQLDHLFPFNRFAKTNKLAYGYFRTIKEEV